VTPVPVPWPSTHLDRHPATLSDVATTCLGLYSSLPVAHLQLAGRIPGFTVADLDRAHADRLVAGLRTLRGSAFLMPVDLLPIVVSATLERNLAAFGGHVRRILVTADYETWAERIDTLMGDGKPRTMAEIKAELDPPDEDVDGINLVVNHMATECRLVGTGESKSWRSGRNAYVRWVDWLPGVDIASVERDEARAELARRYLASHGPATVADFGWWAGLTTVQASAAFDAAGARPVGEQGHFATEKTAAGDPPKGARLLPIWDTLFVTWKDRSRFLPESLVPFVYDASGNATSVVLLDGVVAGVWNLGADDADLEIKVAPFNRFTAAQWSSVEEEAAVLGRLAGSREVRVVRCTDPPDLSDGPRNLFMRPLRDH
jgi:hypothetical protein